VAKITLPAVEPQVVQFPYRQHHLHRRQYLLAGRRSDLPTQTDEPHVQGYAAVPSDLRSTPTFRRVPSIAL